jgi:hypothetical protein
MYLNLLKRNDIFNIVIKKYITFNANNYKKKLFDSSSKGQ